MRKWFASLAVFGLASAAATAQTLGPPPPIGGCGQSQSLFFDDGVAEFSTKVRSPTGHSDSFSVDFDEFAGNMTVTGIALNTMQTSSTGTFGIRYVALCPDNLAVDSLGHTPDLLNPLTILGTTKGTGPLITGSPGTGAGFCPGFLVYDVPDVTVPTGTGMHTAMSFATGDSSTWLCADATAPVSNRSYFTTTRYTTPGLSAGSNLMMRIVGVVPTGTGSAYFTINNSAGNVSVLQTGFVAATLWSTAAVQPTLYLQGVFITGFPFLAVPNLILQTGQENFSPISDQTQGTLCGNVGPPCPPTISFGFGAFYIDNADLKKNGNGKIKQTNTVNVSITTDAGGCNPCLCFGQVDDGTMDSTIWKVLSPAGPADYFTNRINHTDPNTSAPCTVPATVTQIEAASWDFCGTGPSWASVGLYPANTALGPDNPDIANPIVLATTLSMAPNAGDWGYPATIYDFPDVNSSTNSTLANASTVHVTVGWPAGDSCIWVGSDNDGIDDDAGSLGSCTKVPGSVTFFSTNGFTTPGTVIFQTLLMRVDWF
jgi:hypothetical protein